MTRKDYVLLAEALRKTATREANMQKVFADMDRKAELDPSDNTNALWLNGKTSRIMQSALIESVLADVIIDLAESLSKDNPRFDKDMFYDAAGIDSTGIILVA